MIRYLLSSLLITSCWGAADFQIESKPPKYSMVQAFDRIESGQWISLKDIDFNANLPEDEDHRDAELYLLLMQKDGARFSDEIESRDNSPLANCNLGLYYLTVDQKKDAYGWFRSAADGGSSEAAFRLGRNYPFSKPWLEQAASMGHAKAQLHLGQLEDAAAQGYVRAQLLLADRYMENGDRENACPLYHLAAEQDNTQAFYKLGLLYAQEDLEKAAYCFKKAADDGHADACFEYARLTPEAAIDYYGRASSLGHQEAPIYLARLYAVEGNYEKAEYYMQGDIYSLAVYCKEQNHLNAAAFLFQQVADKEEWHVANHEIGLCYKNGLGVEKNPERAFYYFNRCVDKTEWSRMKPHCRMHTITSFHLERYALPAQVTELRDQWVLSSVTGEIGGDGRREHAFYAAEMGHVGGMLRVGEFRDVPLEVKLTYLTRAHDADHAPAKELLADICLEYAKAHPEDQREYLQRSSDLGNTEACYELAQIEEAEGNNVKARELYQLASKSWHPYGFAAANKFRQLVQELGV